MLMCADRLLGCNVKVVWKKFSFFHWIVTEANGQWRFQAGGCNVVECQKLGTRLRSMNWQLLGSCKVFALGPLDCCIQLWFNWIVVGTKYLFFFLAASLLAGEIKRKSLVRAATSTSCWRCFDWSASCFFIHFNRVTIQKKNVLNEAALYLVARLIALNWNLLNWRAPPDSVVWKKKFPFNWNLL